MGTSGITKKHCSRRTVAVAVAWLIVCGWLAAAVAGTTAANRFDEGVELLIGGSFAQKETAVEALAASGDKRAEGILEALLAGDLYYSKTHRRLVFARRRVCGHAVSPRP